MNAKKERSENSESREEIESDESQREMTEKEFFDEIVKHFKDDLQSARNDLYGVSNNSEERAKELLEIAEIRDLEALTSTWKYLYFDDDGKVYWYDGEDKSEAILIKED